MTRPPTNLPFKLFVVAYSEMALRRGFYRLMVLRDANNCPARSYRTF